MSNNIFERIEVKYLIPKEKYEILKEYFSEYLIPDSHGVSDIQSLYFDTDDHRLIRRSLEAPVYKEKLRLRSYGVANENSDLFLEIKKKYDGIVYKRRIQTKLDNFYNCLNEINNKSQIGKEIYYFNKLYGGVKPKMLIMYKREAFFEKDTDLRITFDKNIKYRENDLFLNKGIYGLDVIDNDNFVLMEIKTSNYYPMWLTSLLSELKIYKTSFSKYGTAYKKCLNENVEEILKWNNSLKQSLKMTL